MHCHSEVFSFPALNTMLLDTVRFKICLYSIWASNPDPKMQGNSIFMKTTVPAVSLSVPLCSVIEEKDGGGVCKGRMYICKLQIETR